MGDQAFSFGAPGVGGAGDEVGGAAQAPEQVGAELRVVPDPGQRQRMQGLQDQRAQAAG
ncbi:hypothetical protein D3C86_2134240 [compost metagenome]